MLKRTNESTIIFSFLLSSFVCSCRTSEWFSCQTFFWKSGAENVKMWVIKVWGAITDVWRCHSRGSCCCRSTTTFGIKFNPIEERDLDLDLRRLSMRKPKNGKNQEDKSVGSRNKNVFEDVATFARLYFLITETENNKTTMSFVLKSKQQSSK